jgi:hypothetical protein
VGVNSCEKGGLGGDGTESSEWFIEDQAFSPSYDLAPPPSPSPSLSPVRKLDRRHTGRLRKRENFLTREGVGVGGGAKQRESLVLCKLLNNLWDWRRRCACVCVGRGGGVKGLRVWVWLWVGEGGRGMRRGEGWGGEGVGGGNPPETCPVSHKRVRGLVHLEGGGGDAHSPLHS